MLDILEQQFKSKKALTANKNLGHLRRDLWPHYFSDMYPLAQEYYHELNPFFLFNLHIPDFYRVYKMFTVRDGMVNFANFIVTYLTTIHKLGTKLYLIHPSLAPLVPPHLTSYFGIWNIVRPQAITPSEAQRIVIFGFACEQYLGRVEEIPERLSALKGIKKDAEIELYLPARKNIFDLHQKETITTYQAMAYIQEAFPDRKIKFLTSERFMERTSFKGTYVLDLAPDNFFVTDNFVHYLVHSRGGTVHGVDTVAPKDSIFNLALSFNHELHVSPFPQEVKSIFPELLFYKKQNPGSDYVFDPVFHAMLREGLRTKT